MKPRDDSTAAARLSAATTRTRPVEAHPQRLRHLQLGQELASAETGLHYRIDGLVGQGGFGQVYLAQRLTRTSRVPATVCIKVSERIDGWLREAYFGQVLADHPRAIRVYDTFPLSQDGRIL